MRFCPLYSGSSGNCSYIEAGDTRFLVDAGLAGNALAAALQAAGAEAGALSAILVTHDHIDHVRGVGVMSRRYGLPVYANAGTWRAMAQYIGEIPPGLVRVFETGRDFFIGDTDVLPFSTPHDAAEPVGFVFDRAGERLAYMTDIGHVDERMLETVSGCGLMLIESNHDPEMLMAGPYPYPLKRRIAGDKGHLSNDACGEALVKLYSTGLRRAVLGHLSRDNNFESLAMETVRSVLRRADIPDGEFELFLAHRDRPGDMLFVGVAE